MHSRALAPWLLAAIVLWLPSADAFSACDDLDIVFMIDTEAFAHPFDTVQWMDVVMRAIEDGSSEDDGFSIVFYGDNIPDDQKALVISYNETQPVHSRAREVELIKAEVTAAYEAVETCRLSATSDDCASVSLMDAFELATSQPKPEREHAKAHKLSGEGYVTDQDDDATRYIFVDYMNEVIPDGGVATEGSLLCQLLEYETNHDNETMHFMLGQEFEVDSLEIDCGAEIDDNVLMERMVDINAVVDEFGESTLLEMVFYWTCPSWIVTETQDIVNLGNHNQWMDIDSIIECHLVDAYEDDVRHTVELTAESYVKVKDIEDSLNTFKVNDYLLEYPAIQDELEERGCWLPVLKILAKVELPEACDEPDCTILQLTVQVPESPDDYINYADVSTEHTNDTMQPQDVNLDDDELEEAMRRRLILSEFREEGILTLFDEHWKLDYSATAEKCVEKIIKPPVPTALQKYSDPEFRFTGSGSITVRAGVEIDVSVFFGVVYHRYAGGGAGCFWPWDPCHTHLYASLTADWSLKAYFGVELVGEMQIDVTDILKYSKGYVYWIGYVPIYVEYYATLGATLTVVPIRVYAGVECNFGETRMFDVKYDTSWAWPQTLFSQTRVAKENSCKPVLQIGSEAENAEECPAMELGFDVQVHTEIGAKIYWALGIVYIKPVLVVPFRVTVPEMRNSVCTGAESSCSDVLMASFKIVALYLQIYLGGGVPVIGYEAEHKLAEIQLIGTTPLGCLDLPSSLDKFYRLSGCCAASAASPLLLPGPSSFADKKKPSVIVFDLSYASSHWVAGLVVLLAALLLLILCRFVVWPRQRMAKYLHVAADCDSEDFKDFTDNDCVNEAKPINVDVVA